MHESRKRILKEAAKTAGRIVIEIIIVIITKRIRGIKFWK